MWALIVGGKVSELTDIDPSGRYHSSLEWVECTDKVQVGDLFDGAGFVAPAVAVLSDEEVDAQRRMAYESEADPLRLRIEGDAIEHGNQPDLSAWIALKAEIRARFPKAG
jgi:hypothetical protein